MKFGLEKAIQAGLEAISLTQAAMFGDELFGSEQFVTQAQSEKHHSVSDGTFRSRDGLS